MRRGVLIAGASFVISSWWCVSTVSSEAGDAGGEDNSEPESSLMYAAERTRMGSA